MARNKLSDINGLFEIHIACSIDNLNLLWQFTYNRPEFKLILASASKGKIKDQYMISKWKNGNALDVIEKAKLIEKEMIDFGLNVIRTKVESMAHNSGVPTTMEEYYSLLNRDYFSYHGTIA